MRSFAQSGQMGGILGNSLQGKQDTSFSSCKHCDAIGQYQLWPAGHCRLLFQLLAMLLQRDHKHMTEHAVAVSHLHSSAVPQCP